MATAPPHRNRWSYRVCNPESSSWSSTRRPACAGRVLDPEQNPIGSAKVTLGVDSGKTFAKLGGQLILPEAHTDEEGGFLLEGLSPGHHSLVATHPDHCESELVSVEVRAGEVATAVELELRRGATLTGEVFGKDGEPMPGCMVIIQNPVSFDTRTLNSDEAGAFATEHLAPGSYQVTAMLPSDVGAASGDRDPSELDMSAFLENMRMARVDLEDGQSEHVILGSQPESPVRVHGQVTHLGEPVDQVMVSFIPEGDGAIGAMKLDQVDAEGRYEVRLDHPGRYLVQVQFTSGGGVQQNSIEIAERIPEGEEHELSIALPTARISGRVFGDDGEALASARVTLTTEGGTAYGTFMGGQFAELLTDSTGNYAFDFLRAGRYTVAAGGAPLGGAFGSYSGNGRVLNSGIRVREGESLTGIDFHLQEGGDLSGVVRDNADRPVAGAAIFVRNERGHLLERFSMISTGADGTFEYPGVSPGLYTVTARVGEVVTPDEVPVRIRSEQSSAVELLLEPGTVLLVRVVDESGSDVDAVLSVQNSDGHEVNGMVALNEMMGSLSQGFSYDEQRVGPLPAGTYTVRAESADGRSAKKPVTLSGQAERRLKIRLK